MRSFIAGTLALLALFTPRVSARSLQEQPPLRVGHVFPHTTVIAPGVDVRTEAGIGALIPWADRLWATGYVAHIRGDGLGLHELSPDMSWRRHPESVTGTFANRLVHWASDQVFIGPHAIDAEGNVRTIEALSSQRLAATMNHLSAPREKVYFLTMEGLFWEVDVQTLEATRLFDLVEELGVESGQPHFKAAHTAQGRVVVANNTYGEPEHLGERASGRLAEWDGDEWRVIERNPFVEVSGKQNLGAGATYGNTIFAVGWDRSSVILRVLHGGEWSRYRLPKGSHSFDHTWNTEWMRIREAQTERYLMDAHGIFYELPALLYSGRLWGIKPICSHLRLVPDFCSWRGLFVMAGDQTDNAVGQPQSGLWFGDLDELWSMGKPTGWGGPWWKSAVQADVPSDPFLMTGFDGKVLHVRNDGSDPQNVRIEVDFLGDGSFVPYETLYVRADAYVPHVFPPGFSAHWVRLVPDGDGVLTAVFFYT